MNHYDILGVSSNATKAEIRKRYQELALIWHPDKSQYSAIQSHENIIALNKAWSVLGDETQRKEYDRLLCIAANSQDSNIGDPTRPFSHVPVTKTNRPTCTARDNKVSSRKVIVVRTGERVDSVTGDWMVLSFDDEGNYRRISSNMPEKLPHRNGAPHTYKDDCPISEMGDFQSMFLGMSLNSNRIAVSHVYCSPALRCIQTCSSILKGASLESKLPINIEPGFCEWLSEKHTQTPIWMTAQEIQEAGFVISTDYQPFIKPEELQNVPETYVQFYGRNVRTLQHILCQSNNVDSVLLIVGHASTVAISKTVLIDGNDIIAQDSFDSLCKMISFNCHNCITKGPGGVWSLTGLESSPEIKQHTGASQEDRIDFSVACRVAFCCIKILCAGFTVALILYHIIFYKTKARSAYL